MDCPHCRVTLMMTERKGIEIDFCPQCRGVWLDKGELDKIIDLSVNERFSKRIQGYRPSADYERDRHSSPSRNEERYHGRQSHKHDRGYHKYKKRKTLLGEIFDIFD